jgi:Transglycosylase-like domain/Peptidase family M23
MLCTKLRGVVTARRTTAGGSVAAAIAVGVAAFAAVLIAPAAARAHDSECHAQQSCPSDDGGYVWTDSEGRGWICGLAGGGRGDGTVIVYDNQRYVCEDVTPEPPPPPAEPPPTAPTETTPPPASTTPTRPKAQPGGKARKKPAPKKARPQSPPDDGEPLVPPPPFGGFGSPSDARPALEGGPYVFPVVGPAAFVDSFGAPRATVAWHHGDDIFAPAGAPVVAVATGTLFSVGWNDIGGKRLWLRDRQGNEFYYAHLSAFSPIALEGTQVVRGEVLGYVGTTGDAAGTPAHLHFEIHPVSMLGLGYDGAVNPTPYLESWRRLTESSAAAIRAAAAPRPGAILLSVSDISTASGLERGSIVRAFESRARPKHTAYLADPQVRHGNVGATPGEVAALEASLRARAAKFASSSSTLSGPALWDALARCEAGGDWTADTGNGYAGGLQFAPSTWHGFGGGSYARSAAAASREEQISVAEIVLAAQGWRAWPACSRLLGLR